MVVISPDDVINSVDEVIFIKVTIGCSNCCCLVVVVEPDDVVLAVHNTVSVGVTGFLFPA